MTDQQFKAADINRQAYEEVSELINQIGDALLSDYNRKTVSSSQISGCIAGLEFLSDGRFRQVFNGVRSALVQTMTELEDEFSKI